MSDERHLNDEIPEDEWMDDDPMMDEEAYVPAGDDADWDDAAGEEASSFYEDVDYLEDEPDEALDASIYEPPQPPITDADFVADEPPEDDGNWLKENWWRVAIVVVLVLAIIALLARACGSKKPEPTPAPLPTATLPPLPTFTPTPQTQAPTPPGNAMPPASGSMETPAVVEPTTMPTQAPSPTQPPSTGGKFSIGQVVIVTGTGKDRLALREGPGTDYGMIKAIKDGVKLTVIGGPKQADGYTWWHLRTPKGIEGWAVEKYLKPQS